MSRRRNTAHPARSSATAPREQTTAARAIDPDSPNGDCQAVNCSGRRYGFTAPRPGSAAMPWKASEKMTVPTMDAAAFRVTVERKNANATRTATGSR
jgi:hypothetical protein